MMSVFGGEKNRIEKKRKEKKRRIKVGEIV